MPDTVEEPEPKAAEVPDAKPLDQAMLARDASEILAISMLDLSCKLGGSLNLSSAAWLRRGTPGTPRSIRIGRKY